jgi:hypothetical protein
VTLNASGPISLGGSTTGQSTNLELGQAATAQISMNDANVRTLVGVPSGAVIMPTNFYGKSNFLDRQTVETGDSGNDPPDQQRGFSFASFGTCDDGTSNIYSGARINRLLWRENPGPGVYVFELNGERANSGWTTLTIVGNGTKVLARASASYSSAFTSTQWSWSTTDDVSTQVFGIVSSTAVCTFT